MMPCCNISRAEDYLLLQLLRIHADTANEWLKINEIAILWFKY